MALHYLNLRRERVNRLLSLAMIDKVPHKALQARFLLTQINRRILEISQTQYSNL